MSYLNVVYYSDDNIIKATEKCLNKLKVDSGFGESYLFFSVTDSYKEPNLARDVILKETENNNLFFGVLSSESIFHHRGVFKKGVIIGQISMAKNLRIEPVLIEGRSSNITDKLRDSISYLSSRGNKEEMVIVSFVDESFYKNKKLYKLMTELASEKEVRLACGIVKQTSLAKDESGVFFNNPITGNSMLLLGFLKKSGVGLKICCNKFCENELSNTKKSSLIIGYPLNNLNPKQKEFLPDHPFISIGTNHQFYYRSKNDCAHFKKSLLRIDF